MTAMNITWFEQEYYLVKTKIATNLLTDHLRQQLRGKKYTIKTHSFQLKFTQRKMDPKHNKVSGRFKNNFM